MREVYLLTLIHLRNADFVSNNFGERELRLYLYMAIEERERITKYVDQSPENVAPWYTKRLQKNAAIGSKEESIKRYKEVANLAKPKIDDFVDRVNKQMKKLGKT